MGRFRYASRASRNLASHLEHLDRLNPTAARAILAEIEATLSRLADGFFDGPRVPERPEERTFVTRRYRRKIVYRRTGPEVLVLDILHPGQRG